MISYDDFAAVDIRVGRIRCLSKELSADFMRRL